MAEEEEASRRDADYAKPTLRDRAVIYQDIPKELLGPESDRLLETARQSLVDYTNKYSSIATEFTESVDQKLEIAVMYSIGGTLQEISTLTEVPIRTIREWMHTPWWATALELGKHYKYAQLHAKQIKTGELILDRLIHRLESGKVSTKTLITALGVIGKESREMEKQKAQSKMEDKTKSALEEIRLNLKELSEAHKAKDVTPYVERFNTDEVN